MMTDILNTAAMTAALKKNGVDIAAFVVECASTQEYAKSAGSVARDTLFAAISQSEGRGRLGRRFVSREGGCYFTLKTALEEKTALSFVPLISVAVATTLEGYGANVSIKWPNDILIGGKKVCGILSHSDNSSVCLGVGINVFNDLSGLSDIATSLYAEGICGKSRAQVIADVLAKFYALRKKQFSDILNAYKKYLNIQDKKVIVTQGKSRVSGIVSGISGEGFLLLKNSAQEIVVMSGDVTVTD